MKLVRSKLFWFAAVLVAVSLILTLSSAITGKPTFLRNVTGAIVTPLQNGLSTATDWFTDLFGYFYRYDALERKNAELKQKIQEYEKLEIEYHAAVIDESERCLIGKVRRPLRYVFIRSAMPQRGY